MNASYRPFLPRNLTPCSVDMTAPPQDPALQKFLQPFAINLDTCHELSKRFLDNFAHLAAESPDQFLPTPISESILRPIANTGSGR